MRLLLLLVGCAGAARSPSPAPIAAPSERPLTPEDVGLPANPEAEPRQIMNEGPVLLGGIASPGSRPAEPTALELEQTPTRPPPFYDLKVCRPQRGCTVRRVVTRDQVITQLECPKRGSGTTIHPLRQLVLEELKIESMRPDRRETDTDAQHALRDRDTNRVRGALLAHRDQLIKCLAVLDHSTTIEVAAVVDHRRHPIAVNAARAPDDNRACIENIVRSIDFPIHTWSTIVARWQFVVEDPEPHAKKPLTCS